MADLLKAKWPVAEMSALRKANGRSYLSAKETADLYEWPYSSFVRQLKNFVTNCEFPSNAFRVERRVSQRGREYWMIEVDPVLGIRALNRHFFPRFFD